MIYLQSNSLLRRVSFTMRDLDGLLDPGLTLIGADVLSSLNGAALSAATGLPHGVGGGAHYYDATPTDASVWGSLILVVSHAGYITTVVEEPVTDTGFAYIRLNETLDERARVFFAIEDISGVLTPGLTPSGAQVKVSYDDGVPSVALGAVHGVGGGIYYYQTTPGDRANGGDLLVLVSVDPANYKDVVARKLILATGLPANITPPPVNTGISAQDLSNLSGWDISMVGGDFQITPSGDWALLDGVACAQQSVTRELLSNPGSFPRRPTWGGGLPALILKGQTKANRDKAVSQSRAALLRNPRIKKVNQVTTTPLTTGAGFAISVSADAVDGPITPKIPVTPVRNS